MLCLSMWLLPCVVDGLGQVIANSRSLIFVFIIQLVVQFLFTVHNAKLLLHSYSFTCGMSKDAHFFRTSLPQNYQQNRFLSEKSSISIALGKVETKSWQGPVCGRAKISARIVQTLKPVLIPPGYACCQMYREFLLR